LQSKLQRLLDGYLDQDIERSVYVNKKSELISEKKSLEEQSAKLTFANTSWLEPFREWINEASGLCNLAKSDDLTAKKTQIRKIFGSNIILTNKKVQLRRPEAQKSPLENNWTALRAARLNLFGKSESFLMVPRAGFEPAALSLEVSCSIQLSYQGTSFAFSKSNYQFSIHIFQIIAPKALGFWP
jgi:hypothetical protein